MEISRFAAPILLAVVAAVVGLMLVRREPERTALGTILDKTYVAPGSIDVLQPAVDARSVSAHVGIPYAESNAFVLRVDGVAEPVRASFNVEKSRQFAVGQRVRVRIARRGLPPLRSRLVVVDMTPAEAPRVTR
jgi:hypothetical protein